MIELPDPRLTFVYRLEATLGEPVDLADTGAGRRRIVFVSVGGRGPGAVVYATYLVH